MFELAIKLDDRARKPATAKDQLTSHAHLDIGPLAGKPPLDAIQLRRPVEMARGHGEGRIELVQVPAQPLLRSTALVHEIVTVVDQQLQIAQQLLIRMRPAQTRLAQARSGDGERVDPIGLAACPARARLRRHQLRRNPHQFLTAREQLPLERTRQLPAILQRPQPLRSSPPAQASNSSAAATVFSSSIRAVSSTATAVSECLCTSTCGNRVNRRRPSLCH